MQKKIKIFCSIITLCIIVSYDVSAQRRPFISTVNPQCQRCECIPEQAVYQRVYSYPVKNTRIYYAHPYWYARYKYANYGAPWYPRQPACHDYADAHPYAGTNRPWGAGWVY